MREVVEVIRDDVTGLVLKESEVAIIDFTWRGESYRLETSKDYAESVVQERMTDIIGWAVKTTASPKAKPKSEPFECPHPGCPRTFSTQRGASRHYGQSHKGEK